VAAERCHTSGAHAVHEDHFIACLDVATAEEAAAARADAFGRVFAVPDAAVFLRIAREDRFFVFEVLKQVAALGDAIAPRAHGLVLFDQLGVLLAEVAATVLAKGYRRCLAAEEPAFGLAGDGLDLSSHI
jgi:hypothetical protein